MIFLYILVQLLTHNPTVDQETVTSILHNGRQYN